MRILVRCLNCGIKWVRVVCSGTSTEAYEDLQFNCPACGSNWYEEDTNATKDTITQDK